MLTCLLEEAAARGVCASSCHVHAERCFWRRVCALSGFAFQRCGGDPSCGTRHWLITALQCGPSPCSRFSALQLDALGVGGSSACVLFLEPPGPHTPHSTSFDCQISFLGPSSTNCLVFHAISVSMKLSQIVDLFILVSSC